VELNFAIKNAIEVFPVYGEKEYSENALNVESNLKFHFVAHKENLEGKQLAFVLKSAAILLGSLQQGVKRLSMAMYLYVAQIIQQFFHEKQEGLETILYVNIGLSWKNIWADTWKGMKQYTTKMVYALITGLIIWNYGQKTILLESEYRI